MPNVIHETIIKDIIDLIDTGKEFADDVDADELGVRRKKFNSLAKNANKLILVFPVLCTKGISIETASMISKALERYCVSLLQMVFAAIQIDDSKDVYDYISKFHRNISIGDKLTVDDYLDFTDRLESAVEYGMIKVTDKAVYEQFKEGMKNFNNVIKEAISESALSDYKCHRTYNGIETVLEATPYRRPRRAFETGRRISEDERFNARLSDNDVKKANELMPTAVRINFYSTAADTPIDNAIIGVKCKLYTVDSDELIERIATKYADSNWVREFVRASTGEISFWKDFVFALDRAKVDAINSAKTNSSAKMWKVLERRATKNRLTRWKKNTADSAPITTLVMSQDEIEYLKKDYDINLENRKIAIKLMDSYNFMGLTIVDEPAESASFIFDEGNEAQYETLSFRNLERESNDKDFRKVINLMTKISR